MTISYLGKDCSAHLPPFPESSDINSAICVKSPVRVEQEAPRMVAIGKLVRKGVTKKAAYVED
jgi:hypothetical protein